MKGQSIEARKKRIDEGRCPIHGCGGGHRDNVFHPIRGKVLPVEECARRACEIRWYADYSCSDHSMVLVYPELLPAFQYLIGNKADPRMAPAECYICGTKEDEDLNLIEAKWVLCTRCLVSIAASELRKNRKLRQSLWVLKQGTRQ
jgi:hypothetical protein